jgi:undecaprenyl diphosphate synthase
VVETAPSLGIGTLTLYAFSADNWQRPPQEVNALMRLFLLVRAEIDRLVENGVRLTVVGQRDGLPTTVRSAIEVAEEATAAGTALHLRLAVNYSARQAILRAACRIQPGTEPSTATFAELLGEVDHDVAPARDVDLLIRTGGEQRLSDFLLWECAYAELYFTQTMWPDYAEGDLRAAVQEYHRRERRFGTVPETASSILAGSS